jgi:hypothetical protein
MRVFKYSYIVISLLSLRISEIKAQNYIGMTKEQIIMDMDTSHKSFKLNTSAINPYYNYLKYEDVVNEMTILFFLSEKNECTLIRKMCDYANINDELGQLNQKYKQQSKNKWTYTLNGKSYLVSLEEGEWYFTITTKEIN